jgi:2TM domain
MALEVMAMKEDELPERGDHSIRDRALERIEKKQEFHAHLLAYVLVNAMLIGIWAVTGAGFFWPVFPLLGWGIGIGFHAWDTYRLGEPSEQQIQREIEHLRKVG